LAKIAAELEQAVAQRAIHGGPGYPRSRPLARGPGWTVHDVVCTSGPDDRAFEERHSLFSAAIVIAGSFQYRSAAGSELMTPGSILLGNAGQRFECGHEHSAGDRCVAFSYTPEYFDELAYEAGHQNGRREFSSLRLPPVRKLSPVVVDACAGLLAPEGAAWEELSIKLACAAVQIASGLPVSADEPPSTIARVTKTVRTIDREPDACLSVATLAREARLSPYHFLRTFERVTGTTPHQYVLRTRLRTAAAELRLDAANVLDIALRCGFCDISTFNRAFRAEFGVSPRTYRQQVR
jgi:AraC family transcriptional regulator